MQRREFVEIIFVLLLAVAIAVMIFTTITLLKNKDLITKDPLSYGMRVHNFTSCSCIDRNNKGWDSKDGGFIHTEGVSEQKQIEWYKFQLKE